MSEEAGITTSRELYTRLAAALAWADHMVVRTLLGKAIEHGEHPSTARLQFFHGVAQVLIEEATNGGGYASGVKKVADLVETQATEDGRPWDTTHRKMLEAILMSQAGTIQFILNTTQPMAVDSHEEAQELADLLRTPVSGSA